MNIAESAERVATEQGMDKSQTQGSIEAALETVKAPPRSAWPGSADFAFRTGRSAKGVTRPREGSMTSAASRRLAFTPAEAVKDALNGRCTRPAEETSPAPSPLGGRPRRQHLRHGVRGS